MSAKYLMLSSVHVFFNCCWTCTLFDDSSSSHFVPSGNAFQFFCGNLVSIAV